MFAHFIQRQLLSSKLLVNHRGDVRYKIFLVVICALLLAIASQVGIPFYPIPLTLQTLAVLLIAMLLGWRLATTTVMVYLLAGFSGLPVFANLHSGIITLLSPSGGYLIGFVVAALVCGFLVEHGWGRNFITVLAAGIVGELIIYSCGLAVLSHYVSSHALLKVGFMPFLLGECLKLVFVAIIVPYGWQARNHKGNRRLKND